jgi:diaminopimelate epimerase
VGLPFLKYEALGNHFVLVEEAVVGSRPWPEVALALCAPTAGVGSDGLLVATAPLTAGAIGRMRMLNPDGTEDMCGNGARCVAMHFAASARDASSEFVLDTLAGPLRGVVTEWSGGRAATVRLTMGQPVLDPRNMPALFEAPRVLGAALQVGALSVPIHLVSMGTPHCVIFESPPADGFAALSGAIETHALFPERISVMWAKPEGTHLVRLRIWERAAGPTAACGTGAAATAVAGILTGRLSSPVTVSMPGGELTIEWPGEGYEVVQLGPARRVFSGEWVAPL